MDPIDAGPHFLGAFLVMDDLILTTREIADFLELTVGSTEPVTAVAL